MCFLTFCLHRRSVCVTNIKTNIIVYIFRFPLATTVHSSQAPQPQRCSADKRWKPLQTECGIFKTARDKGENESKIFFVWICRQFQSSHFLCVCSVLRHIHLSLIKSRKQKHNLTIVHQYQYIWKDGINENGQSSLLELHKERNMRPAPLSPMDINDDAAGDGDSGLR